jgi:signal transduction histidine kinase
VLAWVAVHGGLPKLALTRAAQLAVRVRAGLRRVRGDSEKQAADGGSPPEHVVLGSSSRPSLAAPAALGSRDSLLRGLKHELRTPLNAILGFTELLLGELDGPLTADERENVEVVREAGQRLLTLINEVLDLSAALVAPCDAAAEEHDLIAMLEEVRAALERSRGVRPVHVRVVSPHERLDVRANRPALARLLRTLGEVALFATPSGEVSLAATLEQDQLQLRVTGEGLIATPDLQMCEPPIRSERERRMFRLRLAIAKRLLETLPGKLSVDSAATVAIAVDLSALAVCAVPTDDDVSLAIAYIASMGHELRTPLNAILGFADLLALGSHSAWSDAQRKSLEIVRERAVDLATTIDDMLDWAKLEAGELELTCSEQSVQALLERVVDTAVHRSGARGLRVALDVSPDAPGSVRVDGARFVQAVVGMLDHAIRSNPAPQVTLAVRRNANSLQIEAQDPGLEIREQDHAAVFAAFRPSYAPTGQRIAGLQLGSSVARSLLRAHGGDVWFESRPGCGTAFIATLPTA